LQLFIKSNTVVLRKMDYPRHKILLHVDSEIEQSVRLISCQKEPETVEWIETNFKEGDVFFDIGANVGAYSLVASKFCHDNINIYSFEPSFVTFPQLCKNIIANGCTDSIIPLQIALSDKTGIDIFNYHNLVQGGALHTLGAAIDYKGDSFETVAKQQVLSYRIDDLITNFKLPIPNHIKLDVDGIELAVLLGAEKTLENIDTKNLIMELEEGSKDVNLAIDYLAGKGMRFHAKYIGASTPDAKVYNYVFKR